MRGKVKQGKPTSNQHLVFHSIDRRVSIGDTSVMQSLRRKMVHVYFEIAKSLYRSPVLLRSVPVPAAGGSRRASRCTQASKLFLLLRDVFVKPAGCWRVPSACFFFVGGFLLATSLGSTDDVVSRNHAKMCDHREASLLEYLLEHLLDYLQSRFYKILTPVATSFLERSTYP